MEPAMAVAVVPAVIGAVGAVLGSWVRARAQRPAERDGSRSSDSGGIPPVGPATGPGEYRLVIEVGPAADRELLPDDHR